MFVQIEQYESSIVYEVIIIKELGCSTSHFIINFHGHLSKSQDAPKFVVNN